MKFNPAQVKWVEYVLIAWTVCANGYISSVYRIWDYYVLAFRGLSECGEWMKETASDRNTVSTKFLINWAFDECPRYLFFFFHLLFYVRNSQHACTGMTFCVLAPESKKTKNWLSLIGNLSLLMASNCAYSRFGVHLFRLLNFHLSHAKHKKFTFSFQL